MSELMSDDQEKPTYFEPGEAPNGAICGGDQPTEAWPGQAYHLVTASLVSDQSSDVPLGS
jgi:hypothetical protein